MIEVEKDAEKILRYVKQANIAKAFGARRETVTYWKKKGILKRKIEEYLVTKQFSEKYGGGKDE